LILHTLPAIGIEASGPCYSVPRLCESLIASGVPTRLAVLDWVPGIEAPSYVERFPLGFGPRRLGRSPAMARWLGEQVKAGAVEILTKPAEPAEIEAAFRETGAPAEGPELDHVPSLDRAAWEHLQRVLAECNGNISETARRLGMHRRTLQRKLQKLPPRR